MSRGRREVKRVVTYRDGEEEEESTDDECEEVEAAEPDQESDYEAEEAVETAEAEEDTGEAEPAERNGKRRRKPITVKRNGGRFCKVCTSVDHQAGFRGSVYVDCPNRPCYLCKQPGHTTMTCPHRIASDFGVSSVPHRHSLGLLDFMAERQLRGHLAVVKMPPVIPNSMEAAIIKLHSRRVTTIEFHPTRDNIVVSGDKKGQLGVWDIKTVVDKTVYENVHTCLVNSIKFHSVLDGLIYTSASDGTVHCTDLETGVPENLFDLNPDGWAGPSTWKMMYGMDVNSQRNLLLAADNNGFMHQIDVRTGKAVGKPILLHTKGTKVVGMHCNPVDPDIFLSCGNDHKARMWDLRLMDSQTSLAQLDHPSVVNSAYFSPISGSKILTTCQDNRLRVWDCLFGDLEEPSREIVHSQNFNRYITPFRAEWDPKDPLERLVVVGRYISEDFNGVALHPVDFIDINTGQLLAEVVDADITTIVSVNKLHPRLDVMVSGSSRSLLLWRPKSEIGDDDDDELVKEQTNRRIIDVGGEIKKGKGKGTRKSVENDSDDFGKKKSKEFSRKRKER